MAVVQVFLLLTLSRLQFSFGICKLLHLSNFFGICKNLLENEERLYFVKITVIYKTMFFIYKNKNAKLMKVSFSYGVARQ